MIFRIQHDTFNRVTEPKILDTILDHIGNTPLVSINKVGGSFESIKSYTTLTNIDRQQSGIEM